MRFPVVFAFSIAAVVVYATPIVQQQQENNNGMTMIERPLKRQHGLNGLVRRQMTGSEPEGDWTENMEEYQQFYIKCISRWMSIQVYNIMYRTELIPETEEGKAEAYRKANSECLEATREAFGKAPSEKEQFKLAQVDELIRDTLREAGVAPRNPDGGQQEGDQGGQFKSVSSTRMHVHMPSRAVLGNRFQSSVNRLSNRVTGFFSKVSNAGTHPANKVMPMPGLPVKPGVGMSMPMKFGPI